MLGPLSARSALNQAIHLAAQVELAKETNSKYGNFLRGWHTRGAFLAI